MSQRNIICNRQIYDLETESAMSHPHPESCMPFGNLSDFPSNPNSHPNLPLSENTSNHDLHHHDSQIYFGGPYNSLQHHHPVNNLDLGSAAPTSLQYNPYPVSLSTNRICPMPLSQNSDYLGSSSNHGVNGVLMDEYGRNQPIMDNVRGSYKRKNSEGLPGNHYYISTPGTSSSSSGAMPTGSGFQPWEEPYIPRVGVLNAATYTPSEYNGSGVLSINEGSQRSVRSRPSAINLQPDSLTHQQSQLLQGNQMTRSFQPASSSSWPEQFGNNGTDGGASSWHHAPPLPNMHGRSMASMEIGSLGGQGYQEAASSRNSGVIAHTMNHQHPQQIQVQNIRNHTYSYHPQLPPPPYRYSTNTLHNGTLNPPRDGLESVSRYLRSSSNGDRLYRPHRRATHTVPDDINRRLRLLSSDDVTMMEFSGFYAVGSPYIDQHRDMRLDIDDMSYEELLALEERIGDVSTGLSEETILKCLKTRSHVSCTAASSDPPAETTLQENGTCVICQVEYEEGEKIGSLDCGHDYHADCIKQWLLVKNLCPICKASALASDKKNE